MTAPTDTPARRRPVRVVAAALALLMPAGVLFGLAWSATAESATALRSAGAGADYLRPLGAVVAGLADAQGAVALGGAPDPEAVRRAVGEVDRVDSVHGPRLGLTSRWQEVRARVLDLADRRPASPDAVGEVTWLVVRLAGAATEVSGASREELAVARLAGEAVPALLARSGDHVGEVVAVRGSDGARPVDRDRMAAALADLEGLLARVGGGGTTAAEEALVVRSGDLRAAAAPLVPLGPASAADPSRTRVDQEALVRVGADLLRATLDVLEERVDRRLAEVGTRQLALGAAGVLALLAAGRVAWTGAGRRPAAPELAEHAEFVDAMPDWAQQQSREVVMVDARSLLGADGDPDEVVRIGRAVRRRWEHEDEPA